MTHRELQTLDEALLYLNEGILSDKINAIFNKKKKDMEQPVVKREVAFEVTSEKRKKFVKKILQEAKPVLSTLNKGLGTPWMICDSTDSTGYHRSWPNDKFWQGKVYKGDEEKYEANPDSNDFYYDTIYLFGGDDRLIKGILDNAPENYYDFWNVDIYKYTFIPNLHNGVEMLKKKLSKYGTVDTDGDKHFCLIKIIINDNMF